MNITKEVKVTPEFLALVDSIIKENIISLKKLAKH